MFKINQDLNCLLIIFLQNLEMKCLKNLSKNFSAKNFQPIALREIA